MKLRIVLFFSLVISVFIIVNGTNEAFANNAGSGPGYTGSPADGQNCTHCHTGTATTVAGWITSNIPGSGYTPGTTYTITATATLNGINEFGFEISPQNISGNYMGTIVVTNSNETQITGAKYITHKTAGTAGTNSKTWTFNWIAPPSGSGPVTFYGAFNCSNNNNMSSGDIIKLSTLSVTELAPAGVDCGIFSIVTPVAAACDSIITPVVKLGNYGTTTLDSVNINYFIDANTPSTFTWIGSLATSSFTNVTLPPVIASAAGSHTFTATTSSPNGGSDIVTSNDTRVSSFNLVFAGSALPFSEGFESTTFPPVGWVRNNPDGLTSWARVTTAHSSGVASAKLDNYNYSSIGARDELVTPAIDLTTDANPSLSWEVAYRLYTNPASASPQSDTLTVYISTDCQQTWIQIYKKYGVPLTTITPAYSTAAFTPTAAQWRLETVSLLPYQTSSKAYIKFVNTTDFENNLYLDDIYINGPAAVNDPLSAFISAALYPNPCLTGGQAASDKITIDYQLKENEKVSIDIFDVDGKILKSVQPEEKTSGKYSEEISVNDFPAGIYFARLTAGTSVVTRKFVVTK